MSNSVFGDAFDFLINMGFLNTLVPFILFYAIVFGMLERTQVFSRDKSKKDEQTTNLHALIAFAVAITATAASQAVGITQNYLPILAVTSVILLGLMVLLGMAFGPDFDTVILKSKTYTTIMWSGAVVLVFGALVVVAYYSGLMATPCDAAGTLTPVNSLSTSSSECTKLMDMSGFPNEFYLMGMNVPQLLGGEAFVNTFVVIIIAVVFGLVMWFITKKGN